MHKIMQLCVFNMIPVEPVASFRPKHLLANFREGESKNDVAKFKQSRTGQMLIRRKYCENYVIVDFFLSWSTSHRMKIADRQNVFRV